MPIQKPLRGTNPKPQSQPKKKLPTEQAKSLKRYMVAHGMGRAAKLLGTSLENLHDLCEGGGLAPKSVDRIGNLVATWEESTKPIASAPAEVTVTGSVRAVIISAEGDVETIAAALNLGQLIARSFGGE